MKDSTRQKLADKPIETLKTFTICPNMINMNRKHGSVKSYL